MATFFQDLDGQVGSTEVRHCATCRRPTDQMFCRDRVREYSRGSTDDEFYWRCDECGGRSDVQSYSCLKPLGHNRPASARTDIVFRLR